MIRGRWGARANPPSRAGAGERKQKNSDYDVRRMGATSKSIK